MNPKRLILAIVAVFVGVWVTDFLIHGVWLQSTYKETMTHGPRRLQEQADDFPPQNSFVPGDLLPGGKSC